VRQRSFEGGLRRGIRRTLLISIRRLPRRHDLPLDGDADMSVGLHRGIQPGWRRRDRTGARGAPARPGEIEHHPGRPSRVRTLWNHDQALEGQSLSLWRAAKPTPLSSARCAGGAARPSSSCPALPGATRAIAIRSSTRGAALAAGPPAHLGDRIRLSPRRNSIFSVSPWFQRTSEQARRLAHIQTDCHSSRAAQLSRGHLEGLDEPFQLRRHLPLSLLKAELALGTPSKGQQPNCDAAAPIASEAIAQRPVGPALITSRLALLALWPCCLLPGVLAGGGSAGLTSGRQPD